MATVLEGALEPNKVAFVLGIRRPNFVEDRDLFQPCFLPANSQQRASQRQDSDRVHGLLRTHDLDRDFAVWVLWVASVARSNHVGEHTLTDAREHMVSPII